MSDLVTQHMARVLRGDGWSNVLTGLGVTGKDKRLGAEYGYATVLGREQLDQLYEGDDVIARICDRPAEEMVRQGFRLQHDGDAEEGKAVMQALDDLELDERLTEAMAWGRLHGGAVLLLGAEDGGQPWEPLREDRIRKFEWVTVLDRWDIEVHTLYADRRAKNWGKPELYRFTSNIMGPDGSFFGERIHESRVVRFDGVRTTTRARIRNKGWCRSVIERVYPVVRDFSAAFDGMAHLLQDFSQAVFQIKGLSNMIAQDEDQLVLRRLALLDLARSVARAIPLDEDESYKREATPVAGLPELLDRMSERLSAATDMPMTLLMGRSPGGLNATGASDIRLWYDRLRGEQSRILRRPLNRIVRLTMRSKTGPTRGVEPKNWSLTFNPLWQMDDKEQVEVRNKQALTDQTYVGMGVLDPDEVRQSRFGGDVWTQDTVLDPALDDVRERLGRTAPEPEPEADPEDEPDDEE